MGEIFCGIDWAERHHDVALVDDQGQLLAKRRISDDLPGFTELTALLAEHTGSDTFRPVDVAIETDRGLLVAALRAAGHRVFAINPKAVSRYRDRRAVSGAKSDPGLLQIADGLVGAAQRDDQCLRGLAPSFEHHPDAEIIDSLPGLGLVLGARVLSEFGDDRTRFPDAASRRNYAGTSPITRASRRSRTVLARHIRNKRLADACYLWAFSALTKSPGARTYYDTRRDAGDNHNAALRRLANKLLGQLHHCLETRQPYNEILAWARNSTTHAAAA